MPITSYGRQKLLNSFPAEGTIKIYLTGSGDSGAITLSDDCSFDIATDNGTTGTTTLNTNTSTPSVSTTDTGVTITSVSIRNSTNTVTYATKAVTYNLPNGGSIDINGYPISLVSN
jgi:hypothetical protein